MVHRIPSRRFVFVGMMAAFLAVGTGCGGRVESAGGAVSYPAGKGPSAPAAGGIQGTPVARSVPYAVAAISGDGAVGTVPDPGSDIPMVAPRGRRPPTPLPVTSGAAPGVSAAPVFRAAAPSPSARSVRAPSVSFGFQGLSDSGRVIPPDTMGAVGPAHVVSTLNSGFGVFLKANGFKISEVTQAQFWNPLIQAGNLPASVFDPRILFDQYSGRFVFVALDCTVAPNSLLFLAVSASEDATGEWRQWAIDADVDNGVQLDLNWADFPGLGVDNGHVYITANMFSNGGVFQYSKVWAIRKAQLLRGDNVLTWTEFRNPAGADPVSHPSAGFTMQPAHVFGTSSTEYLVYESDFLVATTPPQRFLHVAGIADNGTHLLWNDLGDIPVASYSLLPPPPAPQKGRIETIDTDDTRMLNAVLRNGKLWTTHHVSSDDGRRSEAAWYQLDPASLGVLQQGRVRDAVLSYYYPSIAVNAREDAAIGFSGSSPSDYAGAYFTGRSGTDPVNTMQAVSLLKAGEASYYKILSGTENRWGDYSATCVDPSNDLLFWTVQEYALAPGDMWSTRWGAVSFSPVPPLPSPLGDRGFFGTQDASGGGCSLAARRAPTDGRDDVSLLAFLFAPAAALLARRAALRRGK